MPHKRKDIAIRIAILGGVAVLLIVVPSIVLNGPWSRNSQLDMFHRADVAIDFEPDGPWMVRVDRAEAIVPRAEIDSDPLAKEAWRRVLDRRSYSVEVQNRQWWSRIRRLGLPIVVLLALILFRWWPRMRDFLQNPFGESINVLGKIARPVLEEVANDDSNSQIRV